MDISVFKKNLLEGYESPIEMHIRQTTERITEQRENELMMRVEQEIGFRVDKNELVKALQYDREQYQEGFKAALSTREKAVNKWIPVNEYLPMYSGLYLVSIDDLVTTMSFDGSVFRNRNMDKIQVNAWMPLPEPYKKPEQFGGAE